MKITCAICGCETEKSGRYQKYCPTCAERVAQDRQKNYRDARRPFVEKHCPICGTKIGLKRHICDKCLAEKRRVYQREYHRKIREEQKLRLAPIRAARKAERAQFLARLQEEKAQRAALRAQNKTFCEDNGIECHIKRGTIKEATQ